ncbi:MAG: MogA/MoaB family molybdenum cofactor biosynthesis protein [Candidatus Krumholzibacteriota bacterium]|nr:MogA/MoaB family molybdenum cofactor biosynthesis protein [Candidatus Krumholzibacteriota bacterium]
MRILVLTISDRASRGQYEDLSGPAIEKALSERIASADIDRAVISDDRDGIEKKFAESSSYDVIVTTGGTGLGPRDNTPEATESFCDRMIPGIAEYLRRESCVQTVNAVISRGTAGMKGRTIIINLPGSVKGASFCAELLAGVIPHAVRMIEGGGH